MRSIVVGGLGFLGGAVVDALLERGDTVGVVDHRGTHRERDARFGAGRVLGWRGDILDPATLMPAFEGADEIYHFAGRLGTSELEDDVHGAIAANITGAVNVFEAAIAAEVPVVFYPSKPNVWLNAYTITKAASEDLARLYAANYSLKVRSLRYFNAYGPWQATGPIRKIIPAFAQQALRGEPLTVYGDGEQTVDMIHSEDIGRITVDYTRTGTNDHALDCGRGIAMTVNEVATAVNDVVGSRAGIRHVPMRRGESAGTTLVADIAPLRRVLPKLRFVDWQESLESTIGWYVERVANSTSQRLRSVG